MLNKEDIIKEIQELNLPKEQYCVMTGAALVLYGVRENTADIDIGCTWALFEELQRRGYDRQDQDTGPRIIINETIEIFPDWLPSKILQLDGIPVAELLWIREYKQQKARQKDLRDIALIDAFLQKKRGGRINGISLTMLAAYIAFISWRLFFYAYSNNFRSPMQKLSYNMIPFKTISNYVNHREVLAFDIWAINLLGNIAAFMPLGFLLAVAFRKLKGVQLLTASFAFIFTAELLQLVTRRGVFDVDDILLNILGSCLGYGIFKLLNWIKHQRRR